MEERYIWGLVLLYGLGIASVLLGIFGKVDRSSEKHRKH